MGNGGPAAPQQVQPRQPQEQQKLTSDALMNSLSNSLLSSDTRTAITLISANDRNYSLSKIREDQIQGLNTLPKEMLGQLKPIFEDFVKDVEVMPNVRVHFMEVIGDMASSFGTDLEKYKTFIDDLKKENKLIDKPDLEIPNKMRAAINMIAAEEHLPEAKEAHDRVPDNYYAPIDAKRSRISPSDLKGVIGGPASPQVRSDQPREQQKLTGVDLMNDLYAKRNGDPSLLHALIDFHDPKLYVWQMYQFQIQDLDALPKEMLETLKPIFEDFVGDKKVDAHIRAGFMEVTGAMASSFGTDVEKYTQFITELRTTEKNLSKSVNELMPKLQDVIDQIAAGEE